MRNTENQKTETEAILAVQESMLAGLTSEQRAAYDAVLQASRVTSNDPNGLIYCETCGYMFDTISYASHSEGR